MRALCKTIIAVITLILHTLLFGCAEKPDPRLLSAQRDMDVNPDSIANVLLTIDTTRLSGHNKATYYLLLTQSLHKSNHLDSNPRQMDFSLNYFNQHGDDREKMMANFYKGIILRNADDNEGAMHHVLLSHDLAIYLKDDFWIAKTAEFIADLYSDANLYSKCIPFRQKAIKKYKTAENIVNHRYACSDYALDLIKRGAIKEGLIKGDSIREIAKQERDPYLLRYVDLYLLYGYFESDRIEDAHTIFLELNDSTNWNLESWIYSVEALFQLSQNNIVEADTTFKRAEITRETSNDSLIFYRCKVPYLIKLGDTQGGLNCLDSILLLQNLYVNDLLAQHPLKASENYYSELAELSATKAKMRLFIIILGSLFFLCIIVIGIYIGKLRLKKKNLKIEKNNLLIKQQQYEIKQKEENLFELANSFEEVKKRNDILSRQIAEVIGKRFSTINIIAQEYIERMTSEKFRLQALDRLEKELIDWKSRPKIREIENILDKYLDNIYSKFKEQCAFLKEEDRLLVLYLWAGLSPKAISILLSINLKTIYTNRTRVISKIEKTNVQDKNKFLRMFHKQ